LKKNKIRFGFVELNEEIPIEETFSEWYPKICVFVYKTRVISIPKEDLIQELSLHLLQAVPKYKPARGTFNTFAWTCIRNKFRDLIKVKNYIGIKQEAFSMEVEFEITCERILKSLPHRQGLVFSALKEGLKKSEIAEEIKVTKSRISDIIKLLRGNLLIKEFYV